jgi:prolipoprotein diacylglyceryl transferase
MAVERAPHEAHGCAFCASGGNYYRERMHAAIPSPSSSGLHLGSYELHVYGLTYVIGITLAIALTRARWKAAGGAPALVDDVALWALPAGIIGGRIYFDITTPQYIPSHWWGFLAVWDGGLGIWGGIALATVVGIWRVRRSVPNVAVFMDAVAPSLLFASGIGRIGNYFNQELFGGPTNLPWGLTISPAHRPPGYLADAHYHPTFLYELIWDVALAFLLIWLGRRGKVKNPGLFALYVAGYSAFRIFEESLRIDPSNHFLGLRVNEYVAIVLTIVGLAWFWRIQRRPASIDLPPSLNTDDDGGTLANDDAEIAIP